MFFRKLTLLKSKIHRFLLLSLLELLMRSNWRLTFWGNYDVTNSFGSLGFLQRNHYRNNIGHKELTVQRFGKRGSNTFNYLTLICQTFCSANFCVVAKYRNFLFLLKGPGHSTLPNEPSQLLQSLLYFIQVEQKLIDPIKHRSIFSHVKGYGRFAFF